MVRIYLILFLIIHDINLIVLIYQRYRKRTRTSSTRYTRNVIRVASPVAPQIQIAPQIFVSDVPAGTSAVNDDDDEMCLEVLDNVENLELFDIQGKFIFL